MSLLVELKVDLAFSNPLVMFENPCWLFVRDEMSKVDMRYSVVRSSSKTTCISTNRKMTAEDSISYLHRLRIRLADGKREFLKQLVLAQQQNVFYASNSKIKS